MLPLEIYIHIPFCVKKCAYCDFLSAPSTGEERERYVELLCRELESVPEKVRAYEVVSVFFGGGTPSLLTGEQVCRIMEILRRKFVLGADAEITLEMNPGTVSREKLEAYRQAGVSRLSIGLQSVHDEELQMLGRIHTYGEFLDSYRMAREAGFANINVDLISAIPGQTVESWAETLRTIVELEPEHISAYSLIIEPGTPFYEVYGEDAKGEGAAKALPDEDAERQMYRDTKKLLREAGYERYEISNYARPGYACWHNLGYWNRTAYLGFGIGAASLVPGELLERQTGTGGMARYTNPDFVQEYRRSFAEKFRGEVMEREEEMEEFMFLGLRIMEGVSREEFQRYFQVEMEEIYGKQMEKLEREGLLESGGDRIFLTERGIDVSNAVFVEFLF